jgi:hypothetical protein
MKRESLVKKIPWVGGSSISGELAPRGPAPLSFRDFFLAQQDFRHDPCERPGSPNWWRNKTIVLSNAYGSAKVRLNKCAALAARFWTIYFLTASNRGSVALEKRREIRQGGGA